MTSRNRFPFASRESYLEWRTHWRRRYLKLSQQIRYTKNAFKQAQRAHTGLNPDRLRADLEKMRLEAIAMIEERHRSKEMAGQLRAKRLAAQEEIA